MDAETAPETPRVSLDDIEAAAERIAGRVRRGCESRMAVMSAAWFVEFRQRLPWLLHVD